jgi:ABC-type tungstate transport system substrate-binding protein
MLDRRNLLSHMIPGQTMLVRTNLLSLMTGGQIMLVKRNLLTQMIHELFGQMLAMELDLGCMLIVHLDICSKIVCDLNRVVCPPQCQTW